MRAYKIVISQSPATQDAAQTNGSATTTAGGVTTVSEVVVTPAGKDIVYSSLDAQGRPIAGALHIELDIPVTYFSTPVSQFLVRIHGISKQEIDQGVDLNGRNIKIYGGMVKGLPLANPAQFGLLVEGLIYQAFGNWVGTDMTLDLIVQADGGTQSDARNLVLVWPKGSQLSDAIKATLTTGFPELPNPVVNISDRLVNPHDVTDYYTSIQQMSLAVLGFSKGIVTDPDYSGVLIVQKNGAWVAYDSTTGKGSGGSTVDNPTQIAFTDLIGQPTWSAFPEVDFNCVMRSDLSVGDYIKLPPGPVINTAASTPSFRNKLAFQGVFQLVWIRHVGSFRQPDALSWVTNMKAVFQTTPTGPQLQAASAASGGQTQS